MDADPVADLDRIPRQQYFLRTISQAAIDKTAANPTKLFGLLNAEEQLHHATTTLTFDELKALIRTFNGLIPRKVQMETLPGPVAATAPYAGHVVATDAAEAVLQSLMQPRRSLTRSPGTCSRRIRCACAAVNGSGDPNAAQLALDRLRAAGFQVTGTARGRRSDQLRADQIRYAGQIRSRGSRPCS